MVRLAPGDPARLMLGDASDEQKVIALRQQLGLDQPLPLQYARYMGQVLTGNLGASLWTSETVTEIIASRYPYTLLLVVEAALLSALIGLPLGILAAVRRGTLSDLIARLLAILGVSVPPFALGILVIYVLAIQAGWFPAISKGGSEDPQTVLYHSVLPGLTLGLTSAALLARITRASMLEVLGQDYLRTARAKGLAPVMVVLVHALRNASVAIVTTMGINAGRLLGGAVVIETVFSWPGAGRLIVDSMLARDYPVVQGIILVFALSFIALNLLVDLTYSALDPRIRYA
jgi:ABC-type dipeptide/oligopeptide/nickel transport system permease component